MDQFWPALFAALVAAAIIGAVAWVWKPTRRIIKNWWARGKADAAERAAEAEFGQLKTLREQVAERAVKLGIPMPVSSAGHQYGTVITYADGHKTLFIEDFQRYRSLMQARRVDLANTVNKQAPTPLSRRGREWLAQWLEEHPEP